MSKAKTPANDSGLVQVRVLVPGVFGRSNTVVELDSAALKAAVNSGEVDASPEAVAYAESL